MNKFYIASTGSQCNFIKVIKYRIPVKNNETHVIMKAPYKPINHGIGHFPLKIALKVEVRPDEVGTPNKSPK